MRNRPDHTVRMIPADSITVVNSRTRGQVKFRQIVASISHLGLKKPLVVTLRKGCEEEPQYELVYGQGRLEAYRALGQREVPALVVDVSKEELLLMSLVENLARRKRSSLEMAKEILEMKNRGYKVGEIAKKVDLDPAYIKGLIRLLESGEHRLLLAVEHRQIPMSMAIAIMQSNDQEIEKAMTEAYNRGDLKGRALLRARTLVARRRSGGKGSRSRAEKVEKVSADTLVNAYRKETARQRVLMARAREFETRLRFVVSALKGMLSDEAFVNLLRAESLASMPKALAELIHGKETGHAEPCHAGV